MISLRFLWLTQLCLLPIFIQSYPHGSIEKLMEEYMEGITKLKNTSHQEEHHQTEASGEITELQIAGGMYVF